MSNDKSSELILHFNESETEAIRLLLPDLIIARNEKEVLLTGLSILVKSHNKTIYTAHKDKLIKRFNIFK